MSLLLKLKNFVKYYCFNINSLHNYNFTIEILIKYWNLIKKLRSWDHPFRLRKINFFRFNSFTKVSVFSLIVEKYRANTFGLKKTQWKRYTYYAIHTIAAIKLMRIWVFPKEDLERSPNRESPAARCESARRDGPSSISPSISQQGNGEETDWSC